MYWSLQRLPEPDAISADDPATGERLAAIVDRFCKLQDQFAGSMNHAHTMLGEKRRSFHDVVVWAIAEQILPDETTWLELRSLRNRLTHEYDLADDILPELMPLIRQARDTLHDAIKRFSQLCAQRHLTR